MPDDVPPPEPQDRDLEPSQGGLGGPSLDDLYDPATLAAIEAWARRRVAGVDGGTSGPATAGGVRGLGASLLAAGLLGLADALEGRDDHHEVVEEAPEPAVADEAVTFRFVPGDPRASRIIVRPWLLGDT